MAGVVLMVDFCDVGLMVRIVFDVGLFCGFLW